MVARSNHDHDDGEVCRGCLFRKALKEHLQYAASGSVEHWHDVAGELLLLLTQATSQLVFLRAVSLEGSGDDDDAAEAADLLSQIGAELENLFVELTEGDGDDNDEAG